jgi:hypothetical protein
MSRADDRLMAAVVAEHAAIFGYGPVGARLDASTVTLAQAAEAAHRARRDAVVMRLLARGVKAPVAEPAYALPAPVTDQASALKLAIMIEERTAASWRAALIDTTDDDRRLAVDGLIDCAIRATRFRKAAGVTPTTVAFPGRLEPN